MSEPEQTTAPASSSQTPADNPLDIVRKAAKTRGQKLRLTPVVIDVLCRVVRAGNFIQTAVRFAGISDATYYRWMARATEARENREAGKPISPRDRLCIDLQDALKTAESQGEIGTVSKITSAFGENPQLALEFLSRRHSARWGRKDRHEFIDVTKLTTDELLALESMMLKAGDGQ
jgi:hypothetical protein